MANTALITGGAGALGFSTINVFLDAGWHVVAPVRPGRAGDVPADCFPVEADLTSAADTAAAVAAATDDPASPLTAVVNLVGGFASGGLIADTPVEDFEAMLSMNLRPTYLLTAAALPYLIGAGGGSVVCVSSRAALSPFPGAAGYVTAKAAVLAFAAAVDVEYRKRGVRCNTVLPSVIDTPTNRAAMPDADHDRWVSPAAIAETILFLASKASAPVSGAQIPVYGQA
ncbi:SDR family NAD(P)-dependent oxidoreductase [Actinoplanes derwentensis]|uniref:NAD(P)-dependent dehydrogenase, short-chain alcohol dehydrogenase family n=1 Tax=Actinoplanes derwentensis TaxID=113562 RepID=A0A1H2CEJ5_9ACTN|nr:SDR family NAD(P)-dependent oxidoreductase [Actinoplanes derwentensis]GID89952.1 short-chain dehydrogenase [Actinoplanes derwentensis]SDT68672.1 NAD(P)-dependent dehydrogenase, short-chain alcohol dehydrogenase family [Actinoplanes derwentensis]